MKIFDMHTHCFPDVLAKRAIPAMAATSKTEPCGDGTYGDLVEKELAGGCGAMILHIATNASQMTKVNDFAAQCQKGGVFCFGSVFPTDSAALPEMDRIKALGLHGIKLHPDYQGFFANDPAVFPVYARAAELGLPIVFHTGWDPVSPDCIHCTSEMLAEVADRFPRLTIIAAHMGGMMRSDEAEKWLVGRKNVYFDTAFATHWLTPERTAGLVHRHGAERIFFATDFPWSTIQQERALLESAGLTEDELRLIYSENAKRVFGLPI